ncbi:hypothetical protein [Lewinella sp. JB7]|uniref:hypothetical protein n=1 Tax=Lewinella sp. JB7 TaxID=2962887 RepID=UPI0020C999FC|nr:hypothetical protein [Lewinella sp. JB7]MCP9237082.1 hypothetical protein [Lewinella sp. JB7]
MAKILPDGLADLCPSGTSYPLLANSNFELEGFPSSVGPFHAFLAERDASEVPALCYPTPAGSVSGAIVPLYCKEVQSPPTGTLQPAEHVPGTKSNNRESRGNIGSKEPSGEEQDQNRDSRRIKAHPALKTLPPFPLLDRLSLTDDRLDGYACLSTASVPEQAPSLLFTEEDEILTYGAYTLQPQPWGRGGYRRVYHVYHTDHLDTALTIYTHPFRGKQYIFKFHVENHLHYTGEGLTLLIGFLDAVGATGETLTHWEIQTTHPAYLAIPEYILTHSLKRKGGRQWGLTIGDGDKMEGMRVGQYDSPRSFNMYRNGKDLERRNRQYIADRAVADGVAVPGQSKQLVRLELHIRGKEFKRLEVTDSTGTLRPVTVRALLDPAVRLAVFRTQIEAAFTFRKKVGKDDYATATFFNWDAIERHYLDLHSHTNRDSQKSPIIACRRPVKTRMASSTFAAKQTVKLLKQDGGANSYLRVHLMTELRREILYGLTSPERLSRFSETLSANGCDVDAKVVSALVTDALTDAGDKLATDLGNLLPKTLMQLIAEEYNLQEYATRVQNTNTALYTP